ncbi:MAG: phosphate signaling complex protein PhoU [Bradyrhizobiaceae bacterium]|nr:MAG: phosphate signaling complex protein PhoU [Bradyrhizobiaceae bacterium]
MTTSKHTVSGFDTDLDSLKDNIVRMGEVVQTAFAESINALLSGDADAATFAIAHDETADELERRVEEGAVQTIARRQPLAVDLRDIMAAVRIASDLERIGDLAKNIAKRALALGDERPQQDLASRIEKMATLTRQQLGRVLTAYADRNAELAIAIRDEDGEIDLLHTAFFKESIDTIARSHSDVAGITHLLFCAKNIERIGDHVTNISENVYFIVTGSMPQQDRIKLDTSSTIKSPPGTP